MIEEFEYKGDWWLPDNPKKQISGTLKFTPRDGAVLDLMGSFTDIKNIGEMLEPEIILGTSASEECITLHKCLETKTSFSFQGARISSFYAHVVFLGAHFQKPEDIKFKSISLHYLHLDEWTNISGIEISQHSPDEELVIKYKLPVSIEASIADGHKLYITFEAECPVPFFERKKVKIEQKTYIKIETQTVKSFDEYREIASKVQNFLSLGVMEPVYPLIIKGKTEVNRVLIEDRIHYPPVNIFYRLFDIPKVSKTLQRFDMLFTFEDIAHRFESFLKNWFRKAELLKPVYDLYFGTLYNPQMYLQHRFLSLIQAIESYHRRVMKNHELPEQEHNKRIEEVLDAVPEEHKKWLKVKLAHSNEPTLRRRLKEIFDNYPKVVNKFIRDKKSFIQKVVHTRNYLIHYDLKSKKRVAEWEELYHVTQKLKILIEACLLTVLGFSADEIKDLFSRSTLYQHELGS